MFWTLLALLLWIVLGGFISYYGDLQGRRWGKKRVSWLGMRPKHTAILITSLTGGVIALLSVLTLFLIVPPVRDVLISGEGAIRENKHLIEKSKSEEAQTAQQLREDMNRLHIYEGQLKETRAQLEPLMKQTEHLQAQNTTLTARKNELQARATLLEHQMVQQEAHVRIAQAHVNRLKRLSDTLKTQNQNAALINSDLGKENIVLSRENEAFKHTNSDLQDDILKLQKTRTELTEQTRTLQANYDGVNDAYHKLLDANAEASRSLDAEIASLKKERDDFARQRDLLYNQIAGNSQDFAQSYLTLRQTRVAVRAGGELARIVVSPHERQERVRADLNKLLDAAALKAHNFGATSGENGREVAIVSKQLRIANAVETANEEASLSALSENLTGLNTPEIVVAYAVYNSLHGEPALIEIKYTQVLPVYKKGESVASRNVDVRQGIDDVFADIMEFLQKDVRDAAITKGIRPRIDPQTGVPEVGVASYSDLFRLTEQARRLGGTVKVSARARQDLTSADALSLDLRVERVVKNADDAR